MIKMVKVSALLLAVFLCAGGFMDAAGKRKARSARTACWN